jgi:hypothetical protein
MSRSVRTTCYHGNGEVEDVIFLDHVVYELLALFVHDEYLPL